eukprot:105985-Rhodomonas_salina.2
MPQLVLTSRLLLPGRQFGMGGRADGQRLRLGIVLPPLVRRSCCLTLLLCDAGDADVKCVAARSCKRKCACALARPDVRHA